MVGLETLPRRLAVDVNEEFDRRIEWKVGHPIVSRIEAITHNLPAVASVPVVELLFPATLHASIHKHIGRSPIFELQAPASPV
jgi:hypothetical protein